jgi:hypothetical protein
MRREMQTGEIYRDGTGESYPHYPTFQYLYGKYNGKLAMGKVNGKSLPHVVMK